MNLENKSKDELINELVYLRDKTHAELTHGICPDCAKASVEDFERDKNSNGNKE